MGDTVYLTVISFFVQTLGLLLNIFVSKTLGTAAVGIMTLIFSFFGFFMVLANGNIYTSTSRFVSELIGSGGCGVKQYMRSAFIFALSLSSLFSLIILAFADWFAYDVIGNPDAALSLRLLAVSLPMAATGSCIKGYFSALRTIKIPCVADITEFLVRAAVLAASIVLVISHRLDIFIAIALSVLTGEAVSCTYLVASYLKKRPCDNAECSRGAKLPELVSYIKKVFPILLSGYVYMLLSSANEALVPIMLLKFSSSGERALSEYGIFEAMVMPVIFFPSVVMSSLSGILVPEIAREKSAGNASAVRRLTSGVFRRCFGYSVLVAGGMLIGGRELGAVICPDPLLGSTLCILAPVIPFIYLEIIMEGILRGLGKQNFSTINIAVEYAIRILCVLVFVPFIGYGGILISYFASNIVCNIVRICVVSRHTGVKFSLTSFILKPMFIFVFGWQMAVLTSEMTDRFFDIPLMKLAFYLLFSLSAAYLTDRYSLRAFFKKSLA